MQNEWLILVVLPPVYIALEHIVVSFLVLPQVQFRLQVVFHVLFYFYLGLYWYFLVDVEFEEFGDVGGLEAEGAGPVEAFAGEFVLVDVGGFTDGVGEVGEVLFDFVRVLVDEDDDFGSLHDHFDVVFGFVEFAGRRLELGDHKGL